MSTATNTDLKQIALDALAACGADINAHKAGGKELTTRTPLTGESVLTIGSDTRESAEEKVGKAHAAFTAWREIPAPKRGDVVRRWGELLVEHKRDLAVLVQLEAGKSMSEAEGEVQEMIDICQFAVGQSRRRAERGDPQPAPSRQFDRPQ